MTGLSPRRPWVQGSPRPSSRRRRDRLTGGGKPAGAPRDAGGPGGRDACPEPAGRTPPPPSPSPPSSPKPAETTRETGGNDIRFDASGRLSAPGPPTDRRPTADRPLRGARDGAGCPNLPQRPRSRRNAGKETLIFRAFLRGRSRLGAPLWQIWTRPAQTSPRSPTRPTAPIPTSRSRRDKARCTRRRSASEDEKAQQTRVRDPGPIPPDRHDRHDRPTAMTDRAVGAGSGEGEHAGPPCQGRSARHRLNRRHRGP